MSREIFELKFIFGLKLKEIRQQQGLSYQELKERSGLSLSYLSEIENGKKYPKGDKIMVLAEALGVSYDELVSLQVPTKLKPVVSLIRSDFFKAFPMEQFGLNPQKLVEIISYDPEKINSFLKTMLQVARNYELKQENFYQAALRSYQELNQNYFDGLEEEVDGLRLEFPELSEIPFNEKVLSGILMKIGVRIEFDSIAKYPSLKNLRSLYNPEERLLHLNNGLNNGQVNFLLGREIAFQWMRMKNRSLGTPPQRVMDFEENLNNLKASYFSAALMMPKKNLSEDFKAFGKQKTWKPELFLQLMEKYHVTPEMLMQRLTNILPTVFGFENLFFLRFVAHSADSYTLTKELHLSERNDPHHANELNEHYCRRWVSLEILKDLYEQVKKTPEKQFIAAVQRSRYFESESEYLCLSIAFPNVSNKEEAISVTVGFLIDDALEEHLKFLDDPKIPSKLVNTTCERCPIADCKERAFDAVIYEQSQQEEEIKQDIVDLLGAHQKASTPTS